MKKVITMMTILTLLLTGCSTEIPNEEVNSTVESSVEESTVESSEVIKDIHEHNYVEERVDATCEENGSITYTCECGDSYVEELEALGHNFSEYVYNNDATYTEDGTKTATCICGLTDTLPAEDTKLYVFTIIEKTMYCVEGSNLRDNPSNEGNKIARVNKGTELSVIGICEEANYYRVLYDGQILYTLISNLSDTKPVEKTPTTNQNITSNTNTNTGSSSSSNTTTNNTTTNNNTSSGNTEPAPAPTPEPAPACTHPGGHQAQRCDASQSYTIDLSTGAKITDTTGKCWQDYNYYITYCDLCGTVLRESLSPAGGQHYDVRTPRIAPTCTTDGHTGTTTCQCGACNDAGTVIPATGHNFVTECTGEFSEDGRLVKYKSYCLACGLVDREWYDF